MITLELIDYIKNQIKLGRSEDIIKSILINNGWNQVDIDEAFKTIISGALNTPFPQSAPKGFQPVFSSSAGQTELPLLSAGDLLKQSWQIYKSRFWTLLGIALFPFLGVLGIGLMVLLIIGAQKSNLSVWLTFILFGVAGIFMLLTAILFFWSKIALLFAIKDSVELIGVKESFKRAKGKISALLFINILVILIIFGGFILLIIPAIIFGIWFCLANFVFVAEGHNGLNALLRSKEYVSGRWWSVFWRMLAIGSIGILIYLLEIGVGFIPSKLFIDIASIIFGIVNFLFYILFTIYIFSLYNTLKETRPHLINQPVSAKKGFFVFCAILGVIAIPVIIVVSMMFSFFFIQKFAQKNISDMQSVFNEDTKSNFELLKDISGKAIDIPSVTVHSPNGGEKWYVGKTYTIKWQGPESGKATLFVIDTYFEPKVSGYIAKIAEVPPYGSYQWKIPNIIKSFDGGADVVLGTGDRFKILILYENTTNNELIQKADKSDKTFTIVM